MLLLILYELVSLSNESLDLLSQSRIANVLFKLFPDLVHVFYVFDLLSLVQLVNVVFEGHHTLGAGLLRNHELVPVYFLIVFIFLLLINFLREVKSHAFQDLARQWSNVLVQLHVENVLSWQILLQDTQKLHSLLRRNAGGSDDRGLLHKLLRHFGPDHQLRGKLPDESVQLMLHRCLHMRWGSR